jgi:hypothetical protein
MSQYDNTYYNGTSNAPHNFIAAELQGTWEMKMKSFVRHGISKKTVQEMKEEEGNLTAVQRQNPDFEHLQEIVWMLLWIVLLPGTPPSQCSGKR